MDRRARWHRAAPVAWPDEPRLISGEHQRRGQRGQGLPRPEAGAGVGARAAQRAALIQIGPIRKRNGPKTVSCPVRPCRQVVAPRRWVPSLRSVTVMGRCLPSTWNGLWNGAPDNPSAASAVSAMTCAIGAASAHGARGRTFCKRQDGEGVESRERSGHVADRMGPSFRAWTWTGSWTGSPDTPSATSAIDAMACAIVAASGPAAQEHAPRNASLT
jgi:hypothetical protein